MYPADLDQNFILERQKSFAASRRYFYGLSYQCRKNCLFIPPAVPAQSASGCPYRAADLIVVQIKRKAPPFCHDMRLYNRHPADHLEYRIRHFFCGFLGCTSYLLRVSIKIKEKHFGDPDPFYSDTADILRCGSFLRSDQLHVWRRNDTRT